MKSILLLSACVASVTLCLGRPSSDTSRRSSQQEEVLSSLATIKAATAKIEQCLAANEVETLSSMESDAASERSNSPPAEISEVVNISQEEINTLVNVVYSQAISGIKDAESITLVKKNMTEIAMLGEKIQLILNPNQAIANELAPQFVRISNSSEVTQLRDMIVVAAQASEGLIKEHEKYLKSKIYKKHIEQLKEMQGVLSSLAVKLMRGIMYDKAKPKDETADGYQISVAGQVLVNTFSKAFVKLGLKRRNGVNDDGSLMELDAKTSIAQGSPEDDAVIHTLEILVKLGTSQMDLIPSGLGVDHMTLLKSGVNLSSISHQYYAVHGKKVYYATLKDGRYFFDKNAHPVHTLTDQELVTLTASVNHLLRTALERSQFRSPKFSPLRMVLKAKSNLTAIDTTSGAQEAVAESE